MHERTLLGIALILAVIGLGALWAIPERPYDEVNAYITWTNGTNAWAYTQEPTWITFSEDYTGPTGRCIVLTGHAGTGGVTSARPSASASQPLRRCQ